MAVRRRNLVVKLNENVKKKNIFLENRDSQVDLQVQDTERKQYLKRKLKANNKLDSFSIDEKFRLFLKTVSEGPCHVCASCKQLYIAL